MKNLLKILLIAFITFFVISIKVVKAADGYCKYGNFTVELTDSSINVLYNGSEKELNIKNNLSRTQFMKSGKITCLDQIYYQTDYDNEEIIYTVTAYKAGVVKYWGKKSQIIDSELAVCNYGTISIEMNKTGLFSAKMNGEVSANINISKIDKKVFELGEGYQCPLNLYYVHQIEQENMIFYLSDSYLGLYGDYEAIKLDLNGSDINNDLEAATDFNFCDGNVLKGLKIISTIIFIVKILIPILLIIFGTIDFAKAIISSKEDQIPTAAKTLVMRTISGIIIFFIPTIINVTLSLVKEYDEFKVNNGYIDCTQCIFDYKKCDKYVEGE